ncbi:AraC family transcriptional regulator [Kineococcus siccus]
MGDVAADLGYADQPHFHRDPTRVTGMTPGQFAARFAPVADD